MSKVCVCVPLYNGAAFINELLGSLKKQTFHDFAVLIGNDVSTDNSVELIRPFLADPRFRLLRYEKNSGFYPNISRLIEEASASEYFVLPGQDDLYAPEFLARHVEFLDAHPRVGAVHSRSTLVDENSQQIEENYWYWARLREVMSGGDLLEAIFTHDFVCLPAGVIRMAAFREIHADFLKNVFTYTPDWCTWLLLAARGWEFGYLSEPDCFYRIHSGQLTQTMSSAQKTAEVALVVANVANLLDGVKYGAFMPAGRRRTIRFLANARLLRRGIAMCLRGYGKKYGLDLIRAAITNCPWILPGLPYTSLRFGYAKLKQHKLCSGLIELLHPLGAR